MQLNWVPDAFFVAREIANEIARAGITGVSFGPAVTGRWEEVLGDRVQMLIPAVVVCAETSHLPPVTCRSKNEEAVRIGATVEKWRKERPLKTALPLSPALQERFREMREKIAALPFCGTVKHHSPTSLAIIPDSTTGAPDSRMVRKPSLGIPVDSGLLNWSAIGGGKDSSSEKCGQVDSPHASRLTTRYPVFYSDSS